MLTIENIEKLKGLGLKINDKAYYVHDLRMYETNYIISLRPVIKIFAPHSLILHRTKNKEGFYAIQIYGYPLNEFSKLVFSTPDILITTVELYCNANL